MKSLLWKEWREAIRWLPISMFLVAVALWITFPQRGPRAVGFAFNAAPSVCFVMAIISLALGLLQSLPEQISGARALLLTRPVSRRQCFWAKSIVALAIYLITLLVPLALAASWLAVVAPETRAARPSEYVAILIPGLLAFAFYPAALWVVCRPARWLGTKTLPIVVPLAVVLLSVSPLQASQPIFLIIPHLVAIALTILLFPAARHAFETLSNQPAASDRRAGSAPSAILLTATCGLALPIVLTVALETIVFNQVAVPNARAELRVDDEGQLYNVVDAGVVRSYSTARSSYATGQKTVAAPAPHVAIGEPMPELERPRTAVEDATLNPLISLSRLEDYAPALAAFAEETFFIDQKSAVYDRDGYFLLYDPVNLLGPITRPDTGGGAIRFDTPMRGVIPLSPSRKRSSFGVTATASQHATAHPAGMGALTVDRNGVYWLRGRPGEAVMLLSRNIDAVCTSYGQDAVRPTLWLLDGEELVSYAVQVEEDSDLEVTGDDPGPSPAARRAFQTADRPVRLSMLQTYTLPEGFDPNGQSAGLGLYPLPEGNVVVVSQHNWARSRVARFDASGDLTERYAVARYRDVEPLGLRTASVVFVPPVTVAIAGGHTALQDWLTEGLSEEDSYRITPAGNWIIYGLLALAHSLFSCVLTVAVCRRRDLSSKRIVAWAVLSSLLGIGTAVAVIAIYPRVLFEPCEHCGAAFRIDTTTCSSCGSRRESAPRVGIEILEPGTQSAPVLATGAC